MPDLPPNEEQTTTNEELKNSNSNQNVSSKNEENSESCNTDETANPNDDDEAGKTEENQPKTVGEAIKKGVMETIDIFKAFVKSPKEIIGINLLNIVEGMAYFGILTILMLYMTKNVLVTDLPYIDIKNLEITQFKACISKDYIGGCVDVHAGWIVSGYIMLITFSQFFLGGLSDKLGPKKMLGISLGVLFIARIVLGFSEGQFASMGTGIGSLFFYVVCTCLIFMALSYGVFNPAIYSLTRMYSDKKTSAVSYAMLYAGMNLGAFIIGLILPHIRRGFGDELDEAGNVITPGWMPGTNGYSGVLIFLAGIMILAFILYYFMIVRSKTKPTFAADDDEKEKKDDTPKQYLSLWEKIKSHPLMDLKFSFFIFILIPVQTLFAYQNILIPSYLERAYQAYPMISDNYETFSNLNPLIVFLFAPIIAALTAKKDVYKMMIIGTTVMALPTFLLGLGTTPALFLTFIFIGSIGESMWQPRFLQHVTQIAPKEKMGAYVGIANLPWFLTKFIVGLYAGFALNGFVPEASTGLEQHPQTMWLIFAGIAMISPIALFLARKWVNSPKKTENC